MSLPNAQFKPSPHYNIYNMKFPASEKSLRFTKRSAIARSYSQHSFDEPARATLCVIHTPHIHVSLWIKSVTGDSTVKYH